MGYSGISDRTYYTQDYRHGSYQFVSLDNIIDQFMTVYVGDDKVINKASRTDVAFFAQRALAELSFDTLKSFKAFEIVVPASLSMILPRDYVNYTKLSWVDSSGIKHPLYSTRHASAPKKINVDADGDFLFSSGGSLIDSGEIIINGNFNGTLSYWSQSIAATFDNGALETGFDAVDNKLVGKELQQDQSVHQNIESKYQIQAGHKYTLTYTISDYVSGTVRPRLVDLNGNHTHFTARTADGTYTETVTAGQSDTIPNLEMGLTILNSSATLGNFTIDNVSLVKQGLEDESTASKNYKANDPAENDNDDYDDETYWPHEGERYGLEPEHAQVNGSYFIDELRGKINFSSNLSGKTVILDYISDSLGTDAEMQVHKFAEEAMYKWITYGLLSTKAGIPEYIVQRSKKEKFAATRQAKLRLSNIKVEEIAQILRGKSKQIKH